MMRKLFLLIFILFILSSCATYRVMYYEKPVGKVENIVLLSTLIGEPELSPLPLLDAPIFNAKVRSKANEIIELERKVIDQYREQLALMIENKLNIKVKYGPTLHSLPEYIELKNKYNFPENLKTKNEYFPQIITASGDINPFKFSGGNVKEFFEEETNYKQTIAEIAKTLNTDLIAVSYSYLFTWPGAFGIWGDLILYSYLYIFNKEGDLISSGFGWSHPKITSGTNIEHYQQTFNTFPIIIEPVVADVANKLKR